MWRWQEVAAVAAEAANLVVLVLAQAERLRSALRHNNQRTDTKPAAHLCHLQLVRKSRGARSPVLLRPANAESVAA